MENSTCVHQVTGYKNYCTHLKKKFLIELWKELQNVLLNEK